MITDFQNYVSAIADADDLVWHSPMQVTLNTGALSINLTYLAEQDLLYVHNAVGIPPDNAPAGYWKRLLRANNAFAETCGGTLGYDAESDTVTLQVAWPLRQLGEEGFRMVVQNTLQQCVFWMQELARCADHGDAFDAKQDEEEAGAPSAAGQGGQGMLKV